MENKITVRSFSEKSWYSKKKFHLPVAAWLGILLVAGLAAAQVLGPRITGTTNVAGVNLSFDTANAGGIDALVVFGGTDFVNVSAVTSSASFSTVYLKMYILGFSCAQLSGLTVSQKDSAAVFQAIPCAASGSDSVFFNSGLTFQKTVDDIAPPTIYQWTLLWQVNLAPVTIQFEPVN